jgi:hypothetical protein
MKKMKKIPVYFTAAFLLLSMIMVTSFKPKPANPSANGQGTLTLPGDISRHFAFHANTMPNGGVQGNGELTYTAGQLKIKFDITCLSITGKTARMSGKITAWPDNPERVGWKCWFKVEDNGEGSKGSPDKMTLLYYAQNLGACTNNYTVAIATVEGGNIQVNP